MANYYRVKTENGMFWVDPVTGKTEPGTKIVSDSNPGFSGQRHKLEGPLNQEQVDAVMAGKNLGPSSAPPAPTPATPVVSSPATKKMTAGAGYRTR